MRSGSTWNVLEELGRVLSACSAGVGRGPSSRSAALSTNGRVSRSTGSFTGRPVMPLATFPNRLATVCTARSRRFGSAAGAEGVIDNAAVGPGGEGGVMNWSMLSSP